jgi:hypothetical protein
MGADVVDGAVRFPAISVSAVTLQCHGPRGPNGRRGSGFVVIGESWVGV